SRPVRSASSSVACGCLPSPRCQEPWPNAGTTVPSRNRTVRPASFGFTPASAWRGDAPDSAAIAPTVSVVQSRLNSRRLGGRLFKSSHFIVGPFYRLGCFGSRNFHLGGILQPTLGSGI